VHWIGSAAGIDGEDLPAHLPEALAALEAAVAGVPVRRLYCLSYEGGHPDHDAAALLTAAFARRRGARVRAWQLPFYSGHGTRWRFFRLHRPVSRQARVLVHRVPRREALRHAAIFRHHRSQWRTTLGLLPGHLLQRLVLRREVMQALDPALLSTRPHPGPLLYERMLGIPWERVEGQVAAFRRQHLGEGQ
jgi:LmbE family N-acetylglucosaminyl deacetylase